MGPVSADVIYKARCILQENKNCLSGFEAVCVFDGAITGAITGVDFYFLVKPMFCVHDKLISIARIKFPGNTLTFSRAVGFLMTITCLHEITV